MSRDAISILTADHRAVDELFEQFDLYDDTAATGTKRELVDRIVRELSVHASAEEQVLYLAVRAEVPGGEAIVDKSLHEHQKVKQLAAELERTDAGTPALVAKVRILILDVRHHVAEEEHDLFPKLRSALTQSRLDALGGAL